MEDADAETAKNEVDEVDSMIIEELEVDSAVDILFTLKNCAMD